MSNNINALKKKVTFKDEDVIQVLTKHGVSDKYTPEKTTVRDLLDAMVASGIADTLATVLAVGKITGGNDIILDPSAPATAGAVNNSPILYIRGNYDSDSGAPVVSTDIDTTFQTTISTFGSLNSSLTIEHGGAEIYNYRVYPTGGAGASHTWYATNDVGTEGVDMTIQSGGNQQFILNGENANYSNQFVIDLTTEVPSLQIIGDSGNNGTLTSAVLTDDRTWTLPDATGTILLASGNTVDYLPIYSSAGVLSDSPIRKSGNNVIVNVANKGFQIEGSGTELINLKPNQQQIIITSATGIGSVLDFTGHTVSQTWTFPDKTGTVAVSAAAGFTGTGAYTNFTIENGVITAAS